MSKEIFLKGHPEKIKCQTCQHDKFIVGSSMLNTKVLTFFNLGWLYKKAKTLTCAGCGLIRFIHEDFASQWESE